MSNKVNIFIDKKSTSSLLTDDNIKDLKIKINDLNNIYNIIFNHLCYKKNINRSWPVFDNVKTEIKNKYADYLNMFCLEDEPVVAPVVVAPATTPPTTATTATTGTAAPATTPVPVPIPSKKCKISMFDDDKLRTVINSMEIDRFLNKVCMYRRMSISGDISNVQVAGNYNFMQSNMSYNDNFIDIAQLLREKKYLSGDDCQFCDRWSNERNMYRSVVKDLLVTQNMNEILDLMNLSVHLLPSAILNQNQYQSFFSAIDEYKIHKKMF
jgi:hypothetical protein